VARPGARQARQEPARLRTASGAVARSPWLPSLAGTARVTRLVLHHRRR
jgi:hypothetical protein